MLDLSFCGLGRRKKPKERKQPRDPDAPAPKDAAKAAPPTPKKSDAMPPGPEKLAEMEKERRAAAYAKL